MSTKEIKQCVQCAWLKDESNETICLCRLKNVYVYKYSLACRDSSDIGLL